MKRNTWMKREISSIIRSLTHTHTRNHTHTVTQWAEISKKRLAPNPMKMKQFYSKLQTFFEKNPIFRKNHCSKFGKKCQALQKISKPVKKLALNVFPKCFRCFCPLGNNLIDSDTTRYIAWHIKFEKQKNVTTTNSCKHKESISVSI